MTHLSFKQGVKECIPTLFGYAGVGLSFGIVAASQNFSILEIIFIMSHYLRRCRTIYCLRFSDYRYSNICYRADHTYH